MEWGCGVHGARDPARSVGLPLLCDVDLATRARISQATTTVRNGSHAVVGYGYILVAIDDQYRLAYSEILWHLW